MRRIGLVAVRVLLMGVLPAGVGHGQGANWKANEQLVRELEARDASTLYDEAKVPEYELPRLFVNGDGTPVGDARQWVTRRRPEILSLFQRTMFGQPPLDGMPTSSVTVFESAGSALEGLAKREQVHFEFVREPRRAGMDLLLYLPREARGPSPVFLILNFAGNHTICTDPMIELPRRPSGDPAESVSFVQALEKRRGEMAARFPLKTLLQRGYGLATICYQDIGPDRSDATGEGVRGVFNGGQKSDSWSSIGAWAWGLSRAMDYLVGNPDIDAQRVIVMGHSRLGKTALWAGAADPRFAMVVSNCSGCGGAALSRRRYGETVERINTRFPHWFSEKFKAYNNNESALPLDQHMLLALIAPRPLYVVSADEDLWADPRGEFLSCLAADPVYTLLGVTGLEAKQMPGLDRPLEGGRIGFHVRSGEHSITAYDWERVLDFADRHLQARP